jgi:predicted amidohydrolase
LRIGLASPRPAAGVDDGLARVERLVGDAAARGARIVCFPEAYLPGLRGQDFDVPPWDEADEDRVLRAVSELARVNRIAVILGIEHVSERGRVIAAVVYDATGRVLGRQTKNQIDPTEDRFYVPGEARRVFEIEGLGFGIAICHEGWRYPETVRFAAVRGAHVVFHPQHTGSEKGGVRRKEWGAKDAPYYEKAMAMRSRENTIFFASVNYALTFPESATSLIAPDGECRAFLPYGEEGVLVVDVDPAEATGLLARRWAPERHLEG